MVLIFKILTKFNPIYFAILGFFIIFVFIVNQLNKKVMKTPTPKSLMGFVALIQSLPMLFISASVSVLFSVTVAQSLYIGSIVFIVFFLQTFDKLRLEDKIDVLESKIDELSKTNKDV